MNSFCRVLGLVCFATGAAATARADDVQVVTPKPHFHGTSIEQYYRATKLDLDIEGGGGFFWGNRTSGIGFGRVRSGVMFTGYPLTISVGATFEINNVSMATYGAQIELLHIPSGLWAQLGPTVDGRGNFGGIASVGWSVIGIEAQFRGFDEVRPSAFQGGYGFAFVGKLRLPLGFILYALSRK